MFVSHGSVFVIWFVAISSACARGHATSRMFLCIVAVCDSLALKGYVSVAFSNRRCFVVLMEWIVCAQCEFVHTGLCAGYFGTFQMAGFKMGELLLQLCSQFPAYGMGWCRWCLPVEDLLRSFHFGMPQFVFSPQLHCCVFQHARTLVLSRVCCGCRHGFGSVRYWRFPFAIFLCRVFGSALQHVWSRMISSCFGWLIRIDRGHRFVRDC